MVVLGALGRCCVLTCGRSLHQHPMHARPKNILSCFFFAQNHESFGIFRFRAEKVVVGFENFGPTVADRASKTAVYWSRRIETCKSNASQTAEDMPFPQDGPEVTFHEGTHDEDFVGRGTDRAAPQPAGAPPHNTPKCVEPEVSPGKPTLPTMPLPPRDAFEGKEPQRRPQRRLQRRLEEVAKAVVGGYCRLQMPLSLSVVVRESVAWHRLGTLEGGSRFHLHPCFAPPPPARPCRGD